MKAVLIDKFVPDVSQLKLSSVPSPIPSASKPIRVRITHASLTHVDNLYAQGLHQNNQRHVKPPFILGTEFAGYVVSAPSSSSFRPGTKVFGGSLGAYAEEICIDEANLRKPPSRWTCKEACAMGSSGAISWGALVSVGKLKAGEWVCVLGAAGGLGVVACQIALALGANVVAVVGGEKKAQVMKRLGVNAVVRYDDPDWEKRVMEATGGEGVDVVYDSVGAVLSSIKCCAYRGRVIIVGFAARGGQVEEVKMNRILLKGITVVGYRFGEHGRRFPDETQAIWREFMNLVETKGIKPIVYDREYIGLEAIGAGLKDQASRKSWGRAVMTVTEEEEVKTTIHKDSGTTISRL
ncbi:zeta-crystallin [Patellaria atrata CBS 101060]|uniref:Zeta-crystallin n=1 Tax=Patellaria atrata CBS 101060 TaxID=1346257 RepID=A0A9P4VUD0_9PEZI|nr:zeta-crystallin [Patellaria atrata CBS 101060]